MSKLTADKVQKRYIGAVDSGQGMSPLLSGRTSRGRIGCTSQALGNKNLDGVEGLEWFYKDKGSLIYKDKGSLIYEAAST
jgi:hypothetical protein